MRRSIGSSVRDRWAMARRWPWLILLSFGVATTAMSAITPDGSRDQGASSAQVITKSDADTLLAQSSSAFSVDDVRGRAGEPIALKIILPRQLDACFAYLMFRGLPDGFLLSAGTRTVDSWLVPIAAVQGLSLTAPASSSGVSQLDVLLVRAQRGAAERDSMFVRIEPTAAANPAAPVTATPAAPAAQSIPDVASAFAGPRERDAGMLSNPAPTVAVQVTAPDQAMLDRGHGLLASGDVAAARLIYARLAKKGIAAAAVAMAQTYDVDYLKSLKVTGLRPDVDLAREWYGRAAELGDASSAKRLETLVGAAPN